MFVNDIIYRPIELEDTCGYEQKMWYEHKNVTTKKEPLNRIQRLFL